MNVRRFTRQSYVGRGTRFRLYPQPSVITSGVGPETVWIGRRPGSIAAGPCDDRMYVVDAVGKAPYDDSPVMPPYQGPRYPPVQPGADGHFDHLDPESREFMAAHMYGTLCFVLDVWQRYFTKPLRWHFADDYPRLELIPLVDWDNAHSGYGFIETGFARSEGSDALPFCLNFDVLAHELGHAMIYALLDTPPLDRISAEYLSFHESAADCVAMIAVLDFDSVVDRLLQRTRGNIYLPNELNRIGELSETKQIRIASQSLKLSDVPDLRTPHTQLTYAQRHTMSLPLTGAVFDILVEVFQEILVNDGLISRELNDLSMQDEDAPQDVVQAGFDRAYAGRHDEFKEALLDARDYMGRCLAAAWQTFSWDVTYSEVAAALLEADQRFYGGAGRDIIVESVLWRGIEFPFRYGRPAYSERQYAGPGNPP